MLITPDELELNKQGVLSENQLKKIRRKGAVQLVAGISFLIIVPLSILMANINWGPLLVIWLLAGLFFAGVFLWSASTYLRMKAAGHAIHFLTGIVSLKDSGSKHVSVKINDRSFLLMKNESTSLRKDEEFTLIYMEDPLMVVGWLRGALPGQ